MAKRPEIPSDEELSEAAKKMTKKFEEQLSLTTGEALQISHPKVESMFFNYLKQAIPLGIEFFQKMEETPVETVQKQLFLDFLNEITKLLLSHFQQSDYGLIDYLKNEGLDLTDFTPPRYLANTRIHEYLKHSQSIIDEVVEDPEARKLAFPFSDTFHKSDDYRIMVQTFYTKHEEYLQHLKTSSKEMTSRVIRNYLDIYFDFCGFIEKLLCFLLGLQDSLKAKKPDYRVYRSQELYKNVKALKRWNTAWFLLQAFSRPVRNAIAHLTFDYDPSNQIVNFRDNKNRILLKVFKVD